MPRPKSMLRIACTLALFGACCSNGGDNRPFNFLLITMDTTRADRIGAYGAGNVETPVLDSLAENGVLFTSAHSPVPLTLPSHATILTGMYPPGHGVRNNGNYRLPEDVATAAELLGRAGYATAAVVGAFVLDSRFGLDRGFDTYHDSFLNIDMSSDRFFSYAERRAQEVTELAVDRLRELPSPFFLWVHYFDPHHPYHPPEPFAGRYAGDAYAGEIAYTDHWIGVLLDALEEEGLERRTLTIVTSDHGESLGEHGELSHGVFLYEGPMHVPLIMSLDGYLPAGSRVTSLVSLADILPTALDILGVSFPGEVQGRSLVPDIGGLAAWKGPIYIETRLPLENFGWSPLSGIIDGDLKYIRAPRPELYDLGGDPDESTNLAAGRSDRAASLDSLLTLSERRLDTASSGDAFARMDEVTRQKLQSLGYIWSDVSADSVDRADPKDMISTVVELEKAMLLVNQGEVDAAAELLLAVLERDPDNITAHNVLGMIENQSGDTDAAVRHWERVLELNPDYLEVYRNLGIVYRERGELERAAGLLSEAIRLNPEFTKAFVDLGLTYQGMGRERQAREQFARAIELEPDFLEAYVALGTFMEETGRPDSAAFFFRHALAIDSTNVESRRQMAKLLMKAGDPAGAAGHYRVIVDAHPSAPAYTDLGIALDRAGKKAEAVEAYRRGLELEPDSPELHNNLGIALLGLDRFDEAREHFERAIALKQDYAEPWFNLGNLSRRTGRTEEAISSYRRFLSLWEGGDQARQRARRLIRELGGEP